VLDIGVHRVIYNIFDWKFNLKFSNIDEHKFMRFAIVAGIIMLR